MVYSDALAYDILRSEAIVPAELVTYQRGHVAELDRQYRRVVEVERPVWTGSEAMMNMAAYWHNPGLILYCMNPQSCEAIGVK